MQASARESSPAVAMLPPYWQSADGDQATIDLNGPGPGSITTSLSNLSGWTSGATYRVSFSLAANPDNTLSPQSCLRVSTASSQQDYCFNVLNVDGQGTQASSANMGWQRHTFEFTGAPTDHLTFTSLDAAGDAWGPALDHITVEKLVPSTGTGVRHLFTGKERDQETNLDYFGARYMSAAQGRFTSADAPFADQFPENPQSWNLYSYVRNRPLSFVDPTGQYVCAAGVSKEDCTGFQRSLDQAQAAANNLKEKYGDTSKQYTSVQRAIDAYGEAGVDNGVTIRVGNTGRYGALVEAAGSTVAKTGSNPTGQSIAVTFATGILSGTNLMPTLVAHEGQHVADASAWVASGFSPTMNPLSYQTELNAYQVQAATGEGLDWRYQIVSFGSSARLLWVQGWPEGNTTAAIDAILRHGYNLTPRSTRRAFSQTTRMRR